jgi:hypothetical protein
MSNALRLDERKHRISFLNAGPWISKGKKAWREIGKKPRRNVAAKEKQLKKLLKPHWERTFTRDQGIIRDSFDEALTIFQLYELAIETGYITVEDVVQNDAAQSLEKLLWSQGARQYLYHYNYSAVAYLAQRVGVDLGFKKMSLPPIHEGTEGRFASFLSRHTAWYQDKMLDGWLGFLDDYFVVGDVDEPDKDILWEFLQSSKAGEDDEQLWAFVAGAERFVSQMATLAGSLSQAEKPGYGIFYAYWMAKLYGYDLNEDGFFRDTEQEDWSTVLLKSKRIGKHVAAIEKEGKLVGRGAQSTKNKSKKIPTVIDLFRRNDAVVREFWKVTRRQFQNDPIQFAVTVARPK